MVRPNPLTNQQTDRSRC